MHRHKAMKFMNNQRTTTTPKEQNKALETDPKVMKTYKLPSKEFKIIVKMKKLNELPENTDK